MSFSGVRPYSRSYSRSYSRPYSRSRLGGGGRRRRNGTRRRRGRRSSCAPEAVVQLLLQMLNDIKLFHWNTHSYAQHKATDELHERLSGHVDKFVEVLLGKLDASGSGSGSLRLRLPPVTPLPLHSFRSADTLRQAMQQFVRYLVRMDACFASPLHTDLRNIRDEILADVNQFLYLLSLQ